MSFSSCQFLGLGNFLVDVLVSSSKNFSVDLFLLQNNFQKGSYAPLSLSQRQSLFDSLNSATISLKQGGAVANSIFYLSNLHVTTGLIGSLGDDQFGNFFLEKANLSKISLFLQNPLLLPSKTGFCIVFISPDGERTMRTFLGDASQLFEPPPQIPSCQNFLLESFIWEKVQNISLSILWILKILKNSPLAKINLCAGNIPVFSHHKEQIFDLAQNNLLHRIFCNKQEAFCLTNASSIEETASILTKFFSLAVITDGPNGSWIASPHNLIFIPAVKATINNSTGAGDIYAADFLYNIHLKNDLALCAQFASQAVVNLLGEI